MSGTDGKVVAITGASSGIGEAVAVMLAAQGAKVVLGARRPDRLEALATRIAAAGGAAVWIPTDVRRREDVDALVTLARQEYGRLDVLVNNAGVGPISPIDELRVDEWDQMIDINFRGVLYGTAAVLPVFRAQGRGHVVNVVSTSALRVVPNQAVYAATKSAVRAFSEGLRQEAGPDLRVTMVTPGFVGTDFIDSIASPEVRTQLVATRDALAIPPDAIARAVAFAIEQPASVDVGDIVVRPTAQS